MSDSMRPHRQQPTRLHRPWDSPGKNTGVGCHFLLQCMKVISEVAQSCPALRDPMDSSLPGSSARRIFQARVLEWVAIAFPDIDLRVFEKLLDFHFCSSYSTPPAPRRKVLTGANSLNFGLMKMPFI